MPLESAGIIPTQITAAPYGARPVCYRAVYEGVAELISNGETELLVSESASFSSLGKCFHNNLNLRLRIEQAASCYCAAHFGLGRFCRGLTRGDRIAASNPRDTGINDVPNVVFLDQTGELGGAELSLLDIVTSRLDSSHVILFSDGPFGERLTAAGALVTVLPGGAILSGRRESGLFSTIMTIPTLAALVWRVVAHARSSELLYANTQKAFVVAALAGILLRRPVVWHLRDILSSEHFSGGMRAITIFLANTKATFVIANSKASAEAFREAGGKAPLRVIYNGIDPAPFDAVDPCVARAQLRNELAITTESLVGVFGRLAEWKGQHILIEALKGVPNLHAVVVGSALFGESRYEGRLRRQVVEEGLSVRVHFLGFRDDVRAIMKAVDIVVHTSIAPEPFGRVIVEGMLARKPVIATRAGGALEIIDEGVTGLLVTPGDVAALKAAISRLLAEPELAEHLGNCAYAEAKNRFSLKYCLSSIETVNMSACQALNRER
jgi:glycosyltransferase involved in cell wall biosynthesis